MLAGLEEIDPANIKDDEMLFEEGLGLDSLDAGGDCGFASKTFWITS